MLEPDYCKARLLEIKIGRRLWQSTASPKNTLNFYWRVVKPLRQLQCRGVIKRLHEVTATDERTRVAVELIGQLDVTS